MDDRAGPKKVASRRRALQIAVAVAVTGGLVALIAFAVPYGEVADAFAAFDLRWLAPLLVTYAVTFPCRAARFRSLGVELSLPALTGVSSIHQGMTRLLPLRTGEAAFPVLVRRICGTSLVEGFALIVLVRLLDLAAVAVFFLPALLGVPEARAAIGATGTVLVAAALPALIACYLLLPSLGSRLAGHLGRRLAPHHPRAAERLARAAEVLQAVRTVSRRAFAAAALWTMLLWLATFATSWAALGALGLAVGPAELIVGSTVASIAAVLPIGGIGSFGTLEGGWAAGFVLVGVPRGAAVASALVLSGATLGLVLLLAGISWVLLRNRRRPAPGDR